MGRKRKVLIFNQLNIWYDENMKLIAKIKLNPTEEQRQMLHETLQRANAACNYISELAWQKKTFNKLSLQKIGYYAVRDQFELSAQMVVRALGKVADSYKLDKKTQRHFHKHGAFPYDSRILSYRLDVQEVNIWTLQGRQRIAFQAGKRQLALLQQQQGESDLALIGGEFYIFAVCDVDSPEPEDVADYMGVDVGIVNLATTDDGERYSGKTVNRVRHRYRRMRRKLQKKGTKSAKRLLKKRAGKEKRFAHDVNHCVSKAIVKKAKRTERGLALEELTGIRSRVRLRKPQRTQLHSWSFADLGRKIAYKAELDGVPLVYVDPRNTSRQCSCCGYIDKGNRKTQAKFICIACGFSAHADVNAARNISSRGSVNAPYADSELGSSPA
jgi:IS605 OrfB family transposase